MATSIKLGYNSVVKIAETSQFAMRHLRLILLILTLFIFSPALAQDVSSVLYEIPNVGVDVTAKNSAKARDQAIVEAQHRAFDELMDRLGVSSRFSQTVTDEDIAPLVQNFEVENERTSSVRYIGSFMIRFKINSVRTLLSNSHINYIEERSRPYVVLPIYTINDHPILWEDTTKWRSIWEQSPPDNGVVPIVVPRGSLDDVAVLTTKDALDHRTLAIKNIIDKYQAVGAIVATLKTNIEDPKGQLLVDIERFDNEGRPEILEHASIKAAETKSNIDRTLTQLVRKIRSQIDKDYRQAGRPQTDSLLEVSGMPEPQNPQPPTFPEAPDIKAPSSSTSHLAVSMTISNLAEWAIIKHKLDNTPSVVKTNVITLQRDQTSIDLEYHGSTQELQQDISRQGLVLMPNNTTGAWVLQKVPASPL